MKKHSAKKRGRLSIEQERRKNQHAARRLAGKLMKSHKGEWVGMLHGETVAMSPVLDEVIEALRKVEPDPRRGFVFQVVEDSRKKMIILVF